VCTALKVLVMGWPMRLLEDLEEVEEVFACFPCTESFSVTFEEPLAPAEECRMVELLRGHGGTLKRVRSWGKGAKQLLSSAVQAGALPNLTQFDFFLEDPTHREILSGGMLPLLESMEVEMKTGDEEHMAALEPVATMEHMQRLTLRCGSLQEAAFSPFIPPSLKDIKVVDANVATVKSLLRELPSMLQASGARLEAFELDCRGEGIDAEFGAALAPVLRACSPTLKTLKLGDPVVGPVWNGGVAAGLTSCCDTLEVLHCHWSVFSALPSVGPSFTRLNELDIVDDPDGEDDEEADYTAKAWDILANGRLPALAKLSISPIGHSFPAACLEGEGAEGRLARALEAVAGTLKGLSLGGPMGHGLPAGAWYEVGAALDKLRCLEHLDLTLGDDLPAGVCYELGAAIGKLRRLRYLSLDLSEDGRDYHALGQGLAASGERPSLFFFGVHGVKRNIDWVTYEPSLIVPSVRSIEFGGNRGTEEEALLLCCGLVQMGYKHRLRIDQGLSQNHWPPSAGAGMRAILCGGGITHGEVESIVYMSLL
jgi:hypothetical protein